MPSLPDSDAPISDSIEAKLLWRIWTTDLMFATISSVDDEESATQDDWVSTRLLSFSMWFWISTSVAWVWVTEADWFMLCSFMLAVIAVIWFIEAAVSVMLAERFSPFSESEVVLWVIDERSARMFRIIVSIARRSSPSSSFRSRREAEMETEKSPAPSLPV